MSKMFQKATIFKGMKTGFAGLGGFLVGFLVLISINIFGISSVHAEVKPTGGFCDQTAFNSHLLHLETSKNTPTSGGRGLLSKNSTDPTAYMQASLEAYKSGKVPEALSLLEQGRLRADDSANLLVGLSVLYVESNRLADAEEAASAALEIDPKCVSAHIQLGEIFSQIGWYESAVSSFSDALSLKPMNGRAWFRLGCCLRLAGRHDDAGNAFLTATSLMQPPTRAWIELGTLKLATGNSREALRIFARVLEKNPENTTVQSSLVLAYALSDEGAIGEEKAMEFIAAGTNTAGMWLALGECLEQQTRLREAFGCYGRALAQEPDFASPHSRRGRLFYRFGQFEQAENECLTALKLDPDDALAHACLGLVLVKLERPEEARDHVLRAEAAGLQMESVWDSLDH